MAGTRYQRSEALTGGSGHYTPEEDEALRQALLTVQGALPHRGVRGVIRRMEALARAAQDEGRAWP